MSDSSPTQLLQNETAQAKVTASPLDSARGARTGGVGTVKARKRAVAVALSVGVLAAVSLGFWFFWNRSVNTRQIESIAVLPFVNESGNADNEYLSDGMTETLINGLSQLSKLSVKARSTVFHYKGKDLSPQTIGNELSVQAILNGRIIQRGDNLILSLEMVDTKTGNLIWGEQYNRKRTDLVQLQSEIARDVSQKLRRRLTGADVQNVTKTHTEDVEAYQLYLKGRYFWNRRTPDDFRKAISYFQQAIGRDPNYALAYSGLADAYALLHAYGANPASEMMPQAKAAALKALEIDDNLAEAHASLGQILEYYDWDFQGAQRELKRAIELNPNYATAHQWRGEFLRDLGHQDEGIAEVRRAVELDPLSLIINRSFGDMFLFARRYDEAIEQYRKTIEIDPNWSSAHLLLAQAYEAKGMYGEAVAEYAKARELGLSGGNKQDAAAALDSYAKGGWKGYLEYALTSRKERSKQTYVSPYSIAAGYARLGEKDEAFAWLEKAYQERNYRMTLLKVDPQLDSLRSDPRFADLLRRVGLTQ
jgi:TolB-like protein/tetratricopeptide (TPR) repeat protein